MELEYLLINSNKEENKANWEHLYLSNVTEVKTETTTEHGLVTGTIILLDMASIAL